MALKFNYPFISRLIFFSSQVASVLKEKHILKVGDVISCEKSGRDTLIQKFNSEYHFRGIKQYVVQFLNNCENCRKTMKLPNIKPPPIPIRSYYPHQRIQIDLIQMASKKKQHMVLNPWRFSYILSVKDCFSKYAWLFPLRNKKIDGVYLAMKFVCEKDGFPEFLQNDNGKEFVGKLVKDFFKDHDVVLKRGRPRHPHLVFSIWRQKSKR